MLRAKAMLSVILMLKFNPKIVLLLTHDNNKFFTSLDKSSRDNSKYLTGILQHLVNQMDEHLPLILKTLSDEMENMRKSVL